MKQKVKEFYLPDEVTGKKFKKFLQKTNIHFFFPKKKKSLPRNVKQLHKDLHFAILNDKYKKGLLTKIEKS
jgi:hypothetical protein